MWLYCVPFCLVSDIGRGINKNVNVGVQSSQADVEDLCGAPLLLPAAEPGAEGEAQVPAVRLPLPILRPHPAPGGKKLGFLSGSAFFALGEPDTHLRCENKFG